MCFQYFMTRSWPLTHKVIWSNIDFQTCFSEITSSHFLLFRLCPWPWAKLWPNSDRLDFVNRWTLLCYVFPLQVKFHFSYFWGMLFIPFQNLIYLAKLIILSKICILFTCFHLSGYHLENMTHPKKKFLGHPIV